MKQGRPKIEWPKAPTAWVKQRTLYVSVPFTWNLPGVRRHLEQRDMMWDHAAVGGPAVEMAAGYFKDMDYVAEGGRLAGVLQRVNQLATRTTLGCPNACGFCGVKRIEPEWMELRWWPDLPILLDNNLLAASNAHFDKVMDGLEDWGWCDFNQGLDAVLLTDHHAERIGRIKGAVVRLALDDAVMELAWTGAVECLIRHGTAKSRIRSYVLCGYESTFEDAWKRCEFVEKHGALPLPQWYHPTEPIPDEPTPWPYPHNAVLKCHRDQGWTNEQRTRLMRHFYYHTDGKGRHG